MRRAFIARLWTIASLLSQPFGSAMPNCVGRVARLVWLSSIIALALINDFSGFALGVLVLELLSTAIAGIYQRFRFELLESRFVNGGTLALDAFGIVPESEPREVFADSLDIGGARPALVVVFDSQMDLQIPFCSGGPYVKRRKQMAFMEISRGAWRKSNNSRHSCVRFVTNVNFLQCY